MGSFFCGGVSPSKIGLIAPYWDAVQALSKARVFLSGWKKSRIRCIGRTYAAKRRTLLFNWRASFFNAHQRCRIESGTCIMARSVARLKEFQFWIRRSRCDSMSIETHIMPVQIIPALNREGVELPFNQSYRFELTTNPWGKHYINSWGRTHF
jgi:hypothetical protein